MRTPARIAGLIFSLAGGLPAQTGTVQNAAIVPTPPLIPNFAFAYVGPLFSSNIISPRMLAVLSYPSLSALLPLNPFAPGVPQPPTVNATLSIRPSGSATALPISVITAVEGSVTFVVPAGVPFGGAELLYKIDNQPTQWTNVDVVPSSFEFFRISAGGPAIAQTALPNGSFTSLGLATPAQPGQIIYLSGSGLGYGATVSAILGGVAVPVVYAGAHPTLSGHDWVQIQIPQGSAIPDGCYVPLTFTYNQTNVTTSISKTVDGSPCNHPFQLSVSDMKILDSGGTLTTGGINLNTQLNAVTGAAASRNESANVTISQQNAASIAAYFNPTPAPGASCSAVASAGVGTFRFGDFSGILPGTLAPDLGASMVLQNTATTITLTNANSFYLSPSPPPVDGPLSNLPSPVIAGGKWTWRSVGGKDLPVSSFDFTLPASLLLNGGAPVSLRRDQDQTITWNGTAFDPTAQMSLFLNGVTCAVPARAGTITIPAALLSQFRANTLGTLSVNVSVPIAALAHAQFKLRDGTTLVMLVSYGTGDSRPADFQ